MEDDRYVVQVLHHKTVDTHGPAQVVLAVHLFNCLDIFLKELRSKLPCSQTDVNMPLFLSWLGKGLQSSQVTKALGSIFKKAGVEGPIHHTLYAATLLILWLIANQLQRSTTGCLTRESHQ